jgi:hypothetical protein
MRLRTILRDNFLRSPFKRFWNQYPLGTKLTWSFVPSLLKQNFPVTRKGPNANITLLRYFTACSSQIEKDYIILPPQTWRSWEGLLFVLVCPFLYGIKSIFVLSAWAMILFIDMSLFGYELMNILLFLLWFALYRYPIFDIVYLRVRTKMIVNNSRIYAKIPSNTSTVRVVRLKSGNKGDRISCELITGPLPDMRYEALSYVWGTSLASYTIYVDEMPFYTTYNLYTALKELRLPDRERLLWIDAICINQHDNIEKGSQVQMMRDIFANASRTIVWLDLEVEATASTFEFIQQFHETRPGDRDTFWDDRPALQSRWPSIEKELKDTLNHEWWCRTWVSRARVAHLVART